MLARNGQLSTARATSIGRLLGIVVGPPINTVWLDVASSYGPHSRGAFRCANASMSANQLRQLPATCGLTGEAGRTAVLAILCVGVAFILARVDVAPLVLAVVAAVTFTLCCAFWKQAVYLVF